MNKISPLFRKYYTKIFVLKNSFHHTLHFTPKEYKLTVDYAKTTLQFGHAIGIKYYLFFNHVNTKIQ